MSDNRTWCVVDGDDIVQFDLTVYQAKAMCTLNPDLKAMPTIDAEKMIDGED